MTDIKASIKAIFLFSNFNGYYLITIVLMSEWSNGKIIKWSFQIVLKWTIMTKDWCMSAVRPTLTSHWVNDPNPLTYLSLDWGQCAATKASLKCRCGRWASFTYLVFNEDELHLLILCSMKMSFIYLSCVQWRWASFTYLVFNEDELHLLILCSMKTSFINIVYNEHEIYLWPKTIVTYEILKISRCSISWKVCLMYETTRRVLQSITKIFRRLSFHLFYVHMS